MTTPSTLSPLLHCPTEIQLEIFNYVMKDDHLIKLTVHFIEWILDCRGERTALKYVRFNGFRSYDVIWMRYAENHLDVGRYFDPLLLNHFQTLSELSLTAGV